MRAISCHTRFWKALPSGASGRSNAVRLPEKYSASCSRQARNAGADASSTQSGPTGFSYLAPTKSTCVSPSSVATATSGPSGESKRV